MSKYFSYDAIDVNLYIHDTAEEAKQSALDIAEDGYNLSSGWCDGLSKGSQDLIKSICYGVILGGIDLPTRQPSIEEDGEGAAEEFDYIVQPPVIVEYGQNNDWIKCSDRLPSIGERVLIWGKWHLGSVPVIGAYRGMGVWNSLPKLNEITHWKPLPPLTE